MHNKLSNSYKYFSGTLEVIQLYLVTMYNTDLRIVRKFSIRVFLLLLKYKSNQQCANESAWHRGGGFTAIFKGCNQEQVFGENASSPANCWVHCRSRGIISCL